MLQTCPRCSRANPGQALFCHADGTPLGDPARRQGVVDPARQHFPMPFVFPSGRQCRSFDELVLACVDCWEEARQLLQQGFLAGFLGNLGRIDLAQAAREAAKNTDRDRGLDQLLQRLPSTVLTPAKLLVEPTHVNLGERRPGHDARLELQLRNQGMGLITGTVSCEDAPWLGVGDAGGKRKFFQVRHEAIIPLIIKGKMLRAGNQPLTARVLIDSSSGPISVTVSVDVPVTPFGEGVLAGARTPRQVAEKAMKNPKAAAPLFANGAVARWYATNGWIYPVSDPSVMGLAAVQQFFEALGITRVPKVAVNVADIRMQGRGGDSVRARFEVSAQEPKPVVAHATSDQAWLKVNEVALNGRTATVHLWVPSVPDRPGDQLQAKLTVKANGGQKFIIPVSLTIAGSSGTSRYRDEPLEVVPAYSSGRGYADEPLEEVLPVAEAMTDADRRPIRRRRRLDDYDDDDRDRDRDLDRARQGAGINWLALVPVVFLFFGLAVTVGRDVNAWLKMKQEKKRQDEFADLEALLDIRYHDRDENVTLAAQGGVKPAPGQVAQNVRPGIWEPSMRFGLILKQGGKKLTFEEKGLTNNVCVRLDHSQWLFGERPFKLNDGTPVGSWPGRWLEREGKPDRPMRNGRKSVWVYDAEKVEITQTVGLVPGEQSGKLDTCLVIYRIDNKDNKSHRVGLRFMLDTFIGGNDGVPFLIPGQSQLCSTMQDFATSASVPDFIQARETDDLRNPGTIAQIQLKIPGLEPPSRVTLGAWPNPQLGMGARQEKTLWNVPLLSMKSMQRLDPTSRGDSCVVIYWDDKDIPAGGSREVAFAYGLGTVSAGEAGGRLALTAGGSFTPRGEITLTAYVSNPIAGQKVTLTLPDGFSLVDGETEQTVPRPEGANPVVPVTWKIKASSSTGKYTLKVKSSTGVSQSQDVRIKVRGIFGN